MPDKQKFDVIVIGSGSGLDVAAACADAGLQVAVIEKGPLGGTCLTRGCIPSKMYIHTADIAETIANAKKFGITAKIDKINFPAIVKRVRESVDGDSTMMGKFYETSENPRLFKGEARFTGNKQLSVGDTTLAAETIVIAAGARPSIPPIEGLDQVDYWTSEDALSPQELPKSLTIIGGGFIAAELGHFYGALGSRVTVIQRDKNLVSRSDKDIAGTFTNVFSQKHNILTEHDVVSVSQAKENIAVKVKSQISGKTRTIKSEALLVAAGITPNSDILDVTETGVKPNERGFIPANEFLETVIPGIYVLGDIHGEYVLKHVANLEAQYVTNNILDPNNKRPVDYTAIPHAIFSSPQIASVGKTEQELQEEEIRYKIAREDYKNTGMGEALLDETGFVKFLYEPVSYKILGCHILGPEASTLIHEVVVAMKSGDGTLRSITRATHTHPALSEVIDRAAGNIE